MSPGGKDKGGDVDTSSRTSDISIDKLLLVGIEYS